jgi:hypothetical protein
MTRFQIFKKSFKVEFKAYLAIRLTLKWLLLSLILVKILILTKRKEEAELKVSEVFKVMK